MALCKHALYLPRHQFLTSSDPLGRNSWSLAKGTLSSPRANKHLLRAWGMDSSPSLHLKGPTPHSDNVARLVTACCWLIIAILFCKWSLKVIKGLSAVTYEPLSRREVRQWQMPLSFCHPLQGGRCHVPITGDPDKVHGKPCSRLQPLLRLCRTASRAALGPDFTG